MLALGLVSCSFRSWRTHYVISATCRLLWRRRRYLVLPTSCKYTQLICAKGCAKLFRKELNIFFRLIPESPRWLMTQKRFEECKQVLTTIATTNKRNVSTFNIEFYEEKEVNSPHVFINVLKCLYFNTKLYLPGYPLR